MAHRTHFCRSACSPAAVIAVLAAAGLQACAHSPSVATPEGPRIRLTWPGDARGRAIVVLMNGDGPREVPLVREGKEWSAVVDLPPGEYRYFFVIDDRAVLEKGAKAKLQDDFGGENGLFTLFRDDATGRLVVR